MQHQYKEFAKPLEKLGRRHDLSRAFNDLLTIAICSFHSTNIQSRLQEKDEQNEALYMETIKPYSRENLNDLGKAIGILQLNVLDDPYSDVLGEFFMEHITKGQNGQYFTPTPVCEMMAQMTLENSRKEDQRILDPACGSGRMLLSAAKINHRNYFFGADSSQTCAKMATLNFFLNGLQGEVAWMNSLSMEWYGGWQINKFGLGILPIEKEHSQIWTEAPKPKPKPQTPEFDRSLKNLGNQTTEQLTLF
ncbi:hypothetical protein BFP97_06415 [Roseivirga sp. 4D4]|uniref:N-6 DNA methylase n=1 Tax=Roseivirga sp. 4D4 TaxID=1889784 RepID=UPI0008536E8B|nr:N-6 DNA methylase [Roseivirga sp. 4D4]OEK01165.1 hypothetical protein BFP97_06415 [Roseivirga sp. 4D4]